MNALTKNASRLITQYDYEIRNLSIELERKNSQLARLDALIASYDKNEIIYLSTSDSLTKIDGNSSETYDALVATRREVADDITAIANQIADYRLLLADLTGEENAGPEAQEPAAPALNNTETAEASEAAETESETETVPVRTQEEIDAMAKAVEENKARLIAALEKYISALETKREAIMTDFADLIQLYNDKYVNDMTVSVMNYDYKAPSLLSGAFIKETIKIADVFCVAGFVVCMILRINSRRKEEKA